MNKADIPWFTLGKVASLLIADGLFFGLTNPVRLPSVVIIVGFLLVTLTIYTIIRSCLGVFVGYSNLSGQRAKRISAISSLLIGVIVAMQSIGQLTLRDIIATFPIIIVVYFYFSYLPKRDSRQK